MARHSAKEPFAPVGFDYAQAVRELHRLLTYEEIGSFMGYVRRNTVADIVNGSIPSHPQGEALYALYVQTYQRKPPMSAAQQIGRNNAPAPILSTA